MRRVALTIVILAALTPGCASSGAVGVGTVTEVVPPPKVVPNSVARLNPKTLKVVGTCIMSAAATISAAMTRPNGRLELARRIKPGSELVRTWNRHTHRIVVLASGFAYKGRTYRSLSEIAFAITGTKWNGPRFFGLRRSSNDESGGGRHGR